MHFTLDAIHGKKSRTLFGYHDWTVWQQPTLVAMANLLDLHALYYHSDLHEFIRVEEETDTSDVEENVTFMMFTRRDIETVQLDD